MNRRETFLRALVAALRSGKYKQGTGRMKSGDSFCVLGVGCDLGDLGHWDESDRYVSPIAEWRGACPSGIPWHPVTSAWGLTPMEVARLWSMNDDGKTFAEIADFIEAEWLK